MKLTKIFQNASDKNVAKVVVYVNSAEPTQHENTGYAYKDPDCTQKFNFNELKDAYMKGCVLYVSGEESATYLQPVSCTYSLESDAPALMLYAVNSSANLTIMSSEGTLSSASH